MSTDPSTKAKLLSAYFSFGCQVDNGTLPQPPLRLSSINVNPNFSTANVLKLLNKFDPCSAGGPDEIHPIVLKKYCLLPDCTTCLSFFHFNIQTPSYHCLG